MTHKHFCDAEDRCSKLGYRFLEVLNQILEVVRIGEDDVKGCQDKMNDAIREVEKFYNTLSQR